MSGAGYTLRVGQGFLHSGARIVYTGRARDAGGTYLFKDAQGFQLRFDGDQLAKLREADGLREWRPSLARSGPEAVGGARRAPVVPETATDDELAEIDRRLDYCLAWAGRPGTPRSARGLEPVIAETHARRAAEPMAPGRVELPPPSVSTVQKWLSRWLGRGRVAAGLVPQRRMRGSDKTKLAPKVDQLVAEHIDEHYLTRQRHPVAEVHRKLVGHVRSLNAKLGPAERLPEPCYETVRRAVNALCQYTADYCRRGRAYANEKWRAVGSGIVTDRANEVWEIDDTRVDVICMLEDGKTVVGRPWLVVVIDRHTRMVMSFVLTFSPPDTTAAMEALKQAIRTKDELLEGHDVTGKYAAHGLPDTVHVDNAKHYNAVALKRALARLGVNHRTMPVLKAWYKGTVERLIGTLSRQVFHVVPGTTHSGIYERDSDPVPELVAEATIGELRRKLLDWMVNSYQHRRHKGIDDTPAAMWKKSVSTCEMRLPPSREDVESALSLTVVRTARKGGIQFQNLVYHSERLAQTLMGLGRAKSHELVVRIDRQNLEAVEFLDPTDGQWSSASLREDLLPRVRDRTLEEYELACALRRARNEEFIEGDPDFRETYAMLDGEREDRAQDPKLAPRVKAAGERERLLGKAERLTRHRTATPPEPGQDLTAMVEAEAERAFLQASGATPAGPPAPAAEPGAWAAKHNLGARVRKTRKED